MSSLAMSPTSPPPALECFPFGITPLMRAAASPESGELSGMLHSRELLTTAACGDELGRNALYYAALSGIARNLTLLLQHPQINQTLAKRDVYGRTVVMVTAEEGKAATLRILLATEDGKRLINLEDRKGHTALELALANRHYPCAQILLDAGASNRVAGETYRQIPPQMKHKYSPSVGRSSRYSRS